MLPMYSHLFIAMMLTWKVLSRSVGVAEETSQVVNKVSDMLSSKPQHLCKTGRTT